MPGRYWDGTFSRLWYNANGQLARIDEDPIASPIAVAAVMVSVTRAPRPPGEYLRSE